MASRCCRDKVNEPNARLPAPCVSVCVLNLRVPPRSITPETRRIRVSIREYSIRHKKRERERETDVAPGVPTPRLPGAGTRTYIPGADDREPRRDDATALYRYGDFLFRFIYFYNDFYIMREIIIIGSGRYI